jgi:hypothetical protein
MRPPNRIPRILHKLERAWKEHPDLRLGQLLMGLAKRDDIFYVEDTDWEMFLDKVLANGWEAHNPPLEKEVLDWARGLLGVEKDAWLENTKDEDNDTSSDV